MAKNITFKFNDTEASFSVPCIAKPEERKQGCRAIRMYEMGMDSKVVVNPAEINIIAPEIANNKQVLETLCNMGKTFCGMCEFNKGPKTR